MQKQKSIIQNTNKIITILIIILGSLLVSFYSCTSSNNSINIKNGYYYVERIDSIFFEDYNSIFLLTNKKEKIWLLTKKLSNKNIIYNSMDRYQILKEKSIVQLDLLKIDTIKYLKSTFKPERVSGVGYDIDDTITIWYSDTVKYDIYMSSQILDLYLKK